MPHTNFHRMKRDIFSMQYIFLIWKILGVAPYTIKGNIGYRTLAITHKDIILFTVQCLFYLSLMVVGLYMDMETLLKYDIITLLLSCTEMFLNTLLVIICLLVNIIYFKPIFQIFLQIEEQNQRLEQLGVSRINRKTETVIVLLYIPRFLLFLAMFLSNSNIIPLLSATRTMYLFTSCLSAALESIMFCFLYEAKNIFELVNLKMEKLYCEINTNINTTSETILKHCLQIHDNVCNICANVDQVFNVYLLVKFIIGFADLVHSTMYIAHFDEYDFNIIIDFNEIVWISLGICEIIYLCIICEMTVFEVSTQQ